MEIRTLRYFMAIAREENMTKAAALLHVSQSTLSKQMQMLEDELGKKLFKRHSFSISLTEEGMLLRKRAADVLLLTDKISTEFAALDDITGGNIYFGCAETYQIRYLANYIKEFKISYPNFHYHITSGDTEQVEEKLNAGILDFALIVEEPDYDNYNVLQMPKGDIWGLVMPNNSPLAAKEYITYDDLLGLPLFCSGQGWRFDLPQWCGKGIEQLNLEGSFRLHYNASVFVQEGLGYLLTYDNLCNTSDANGLTFRPLFPPLETKIYIIWKKGQLLTPIANKFIEKLKVKIDTENGVFVER